MGFSSKMASVLPGKNDNEKLNALCGKTYKEQAVWFLNGFWEDFASKEAEQLWAYVHKCADLDLELHSGGCGLDEMKAHVFLEQFDETLTVRELRAKLRSTGAIGEADRPKLVPITHYLLFKYNADWHTLVNSSQGDNSKEIAQAQALLDEVSVAFDEAKRTATAAANALREAEASEAKAKTREAESQQAAGAARAAQQELEEALRALQAEEKAYNDKKEELERKSTQGGVVSMNKAKAELAQHLAEDPLPLRKAKITQEAAVKRADKARQAAEEAAQAASHARQAAETAAKEATQARQAAESARQASAVAKAKAEDALAAAEAKFKEAEAYLEEVKSRPGCAHGAIWWMDRELHEQRKYLPTSRGGIAK